MIVVKPEDLDQEAPPSDAMKSFMGVQDKPQGGPIVVSPDQVERAIPPQDLLNTFQSALSGAQATQNPQGSGYNPLLEVAKNPASIGEALGEVLGGAPNKPSVPNDPSALFAPPVNFIHGAASAQVPVKDDKGDLDTFGTAWASGLKGLEHPELTPMPGAQFQKAYPNLNWIVSGAMGTALDALPLLIGGKEALSYEDQVAKMQAEGKDTQLARITEASQGMDFRKEIADTMAEVRKRNPNMTPEQLTQAQNQMSSFVGKLGNSFNTGQGLNLVERIFKPRGLYDFTFPDDSTAPGESAPDILKTIFKKEAPDSAITKTFEDLPQPKVVAKAEDVTPAAITPEDVAQGTTEKGDTTEKGEMKPKEPAPVVKQEDVELTQKTPEAVEVPIPKFASTNQAVAHGKAIQGDQNEIDKLQQGLTVLQPKIDKALETGDMQNGMDLATQKQFINESLKEATKTPEIVDAEKAGKVVGIDADTKLPIIDRSQPTPNADIEPKRSQMATSEPRNTKKFTSIEGADVGTVKDYPEELSRQWYRGEHKFNQTGDKFFSGDEETAKEYGNGISRKINPDEFPKNPLIVNGGKDNFMKEIGYDEAKWESPLAESLKQPKEETYDYLIKKYAQDRGHDGIIYTSGTFEQPEMVVFSKESKNLNKPTLSGTLEPGAENATEPEKVSKPEREAVRGNLKPGGNATGTASSDTGNTVGRGESKPGGPNGSSQESSPRSTEAPTEGRNYKITPSDNIGEGGLTQKHKDNISAIKLVKQIESENRQATPEEQKQLVKYTGWGGLSQAFDRHNSEWRTKYNELKELLDDDEYEAARASTINAHYTSPQVIHQIWRALGNFGFNHGKVLEPSAGVGHFVGLAPQGGKSFSMVELDKITGLIAKHLYPESDVQIKGFQEAELPANFFNVITSNIPFSDYKPYDPNAKRLGIPAHLVLHDYFFAKAIAHLKPGGIIAFITSKGTMDKIDDKLRNHINDKMKFIGALRLPSNAFKKNANTEVVTDLIFLQKPFENEKFKNPDFLQTVPFESNDKEVNVNKYFLDNPDNVIGKMEIGDGLYSDSELTVTDQGNFEKRLSDAIDALPKHIYGNHAGKEHDIAETEQIPDHTEAKEYSFQVKDGAIYQKLEGNLVKQDLNTKDVKRMESLIGLKDTLRDLLHSERNDLPTIEGLRKKLNTEYNSLLKKFGAINDDKNDEIFSDDPDSTLLASLEDVKPLGRGKYSYTKAAIFTERVLKPHHKPTSAKDIKDALFISLGEYGRPDWDYMASLLDSTPAAVQGQALDGDLAFRDPDGDKVVLKDEYLSGNVKKKLADAKAAAKTDKAYQKNISALEAVQPKDLTFDQIKPRIGMPWIKQETYEQFLRQIVGAGGQKVIHNAATGDWSVEKSTSRYYSGGGITEYGTSRMSAADIFEAVANGRPVKVFDTSTNEDGSKNKVLNEEETSLAEQKADQMKEKFQSWFWEDDDRREQYVKEYNDNWNNSVVRKYDGSHLVFPSMSKKAFPQGLRKTQLAAIWRGITSDRLMLAHSVGAGKTAIMITTAMETKRLGLVNKSMVVAPKNTIPGWKTQINKLYPTAKVLVANEKTFSPDKRKKFLAKVAMGDWDLVVIPERSFEFIQVSKEAYKEYMDKELQELRDAKDDMKAAGARISVKSIEKAILSKEAKLKEFLDQSRKDDFLNFEELGVDSLMVDEADKFKNLSYTTQKQGIKGMGSQEGSGKASDMMMKTNILRKRNGKIIFATGTPISNSMVEAYTMMKYLQPEQLAEAGIKNFDDWSNTFGEVATNSEVDVTGARYKLVSRFKNFVNVNELMNMIRSVWDIQTQEMLEDQGILVKGKNLPLIEGGKPTAVVLPGSEDLKAYTETLIARANAIKQRKGPPQKGQDILLTVLSDGRKAAVDMRMIDPTLKPDPNSKVEYAIRGILENYKKYQDTKGTQLVFLDRISPDKKAPFNPQYYMKQKLIDGGMPAAQIAMIHDFKTDEEKESLYQKVNDGDIRVLFGSTEKLGAGTNVQERLAALWHIDVGWRPRDITQREGRIVRPGNINKKVQIYRMATQGSLDTFMYQVLEDKEKSINSMLKGEGNTRIIEEEEQNEYEQIKALSSTNPMVKEKADIDREVRKLKALKNAYIGEREKATKVIAGADRIIKDSQNTIDALNKFKESRPEKPTKDTFSVKIGDTAYTDKAEALKAIWEKLGDIKLDAFALSSTTPKIGSYLGYDLYAQKQIIGDKVSNSIFVKVPDTLEKLYGNVSSDPTGTFASLDHALFSNFDGEMKYYDQKISEKQKEVTYANKLLNEGFSKENELGQKVARQSFIDQELKKDVNEKPVETEEKSSRSNEAGFVNINIFPGVNEAAEFTREAINILNPKFGVSREALDAIMKKKGELDKIEFELEAKLKQIEGMMEKWPRQKQVEFVDNIKRGQPQSDPQLQTIADMMKRVEDNYWNAAKVYKPSLAYKDNHYRVLWKVIPGSKQAQVRKGYQGLYRKPLQGTKGWTKQATLEDMSEGLAMGGVPYSYNPMTMWRNALLDMQKFITTQRMWEELKNIKQVKFVKLGQTAPDGFVRLNDRMAKIYFHVDEGMVNTGEYFIEENAGRVLNNFLSRDYIRESKIGLGLLTFKNMTTALELALSPFHAAFTSIEVASSSIGLGLQKMYNRGLLQADPRAFLDGLRDIALSPLSPAGTAHLGGMAIRFMSKEGFLNTPEGKSFITAFPDAKQLLDDLFLGGGKLAMHQDYKINSLKAFQEGLKNKEPWAVAMNAILAINETIMKPLFEIYIPRIKVGLFLREYSNELVQRKHLLATGKLTRAQLARQVWATIENRFGEMNFDNLFWNRTFKSALQLAFRSVTWKLGSIANILGAAPEQLKEFSDALKGDGPPLLGRKMAWLLGLGITVAAFSEIIMHMNNQGHPKNFKDLIAPRYDKTNRISLNSYLKDILHMTHSPVKYITSSLSGEIGRFFDLAKNKDFYGTEIYNPDDKWFKQFMDKMKYLIPMPFSISNYKRIADLQAPGPIKALVAAGVAQPTPAYVTQTKAQELAHQMMLDRLPAGARTQAASEASLMKSNVTKQFLAANQGGDFKNLSSLDKTPLINAVKAKEINLSQANQILKHGDDSFFKRTTRTFSWSDIPKIMEKATPEEMPELKQIFMTKVNNAIKHTSGEDEKTDILNRAKQMIARFKK